MVLTHIQCPENTVRSHSQIERLVKRLPDAGNLRIARVFYLAWKLHPRSGIRQGLVDFMELPIGNG